MDKNEPFVFGHSEEDRETPKQSPGSNSTWPMDKIRETRFQEKVLSILSPVTPKRNYRARHVKSLLLQCLWDSRSESRPPRSDSRSPRRFPVSYSDDGILMDGVLVTSDTRKKFSDSPSSSLGRSARSSVNKSQHKNTEISSPKCDTGRNQGTTRSQQSSAGKGKTLANSPSTKVETPKAANPPKLNATAKPFILTPRSSQILPSPAPFQQLPYDHGPHFPWGNPPPHHQLPSSYRHPYPPPNYAYPRPLQMPFNPYIHLPPSPHYLPMFPGPTGYQMAHDLNQSPTITSHSTTPSSSQPNKNTSQPSVHTPTSTHPTAHVSTSNTIQGSRLDLPSSVDGLDTVTPKPDLSSPSDELETKTQKPDMSRSAGLQTAKTQKDWSPSDDGLETFSQAQSDFTNSHGRVLPDDVFQHYKYMKRLSNLSELPSDSDELPQPEPLEEQ